MAIVFDDEEQNAAKPKKPSTIVFDEQPTPSGQAPLNKPTNVLPPTSQTEDFLTPRGKQTLSELYTPTLEYGGAALGGLAAAPVAAGVTVGTSGLAIPAAVALEIGAGAGGYAVGGELAAQLDQLIGLAKPPATTKEIIKRPLKNLKEGATMEIGGRIGANIVGRGLALGAKGTQISLQKAGELIEKAKSVGISLSPAELFETKSMTAVESVLDHLPWTSGIVQKFRLSRLEQLNKVRNNLIEKNGSSDQIEELGLEIKNMTDKFMQKVGTVNQEAMIAMKTRLLQKLGSKSTYTDLDISGKEVVQRYQQELSQQVKSAYNAIKEKVPVKPVLPEHTIAVANKIIEEQERLAPAVQNKPLLNAAKFFTKTEADVPADVLKEYQMADAANRAAIEQEYPELLNAQIPKSYTELADNVSAFNEKKYAQISGTAGTPQLSNVGRQWDTLIKAIHEDMDGIVANSGNKELIKAQEVASQLAKKKFALFEDPAFKMINDKYPGAVSETILKSGNAELVQRYKALTGDTLFNKSKDRLTNDVLGLGEEDTLTGDAIRLRLLKLGDAINSVYTPEELNHFKAIAKALDLREGMTKELINNPLFKRMVSNKAEMVPAGIAQSVVLPNNTGNAAAVEHFMGKEAKSKMANAFLPHLLAKDQNGNFDPQVFARQFNQYGRPTLESWYGKDFTNQLSDLAQVSSKIKGTTKGVAGSTYTALIGFYEGQRILKGAIRAAVSTSPHAVLNLGLEGSVIFGTRQLAKLYTSPMGRNLFLQGLVTPINSEAASVLSGKILGIVSNEVLKSKGKTQ